MITHLLIWSSNRLKSTQVRSIWFSLSMRSVHGRRIFHSWEECEKLIASGQVAPEKTVSHRLPMSDFENAYDILLSGRACKIILDPQQ